MTVDKNAINYAIDKSGLIRSLKTEEDLEIIQKLFETYESAKKPITLKRCAEELRYMFGNEYPMDKYAEEMAETILKMVGVSYVD
jgi:hypothetical protein